MNSVSAFLVDVSLRVVSRSVLQGCRGLRWPLHAALEVMYHKLVSQNSQLKTDHAAGEKRLSRKDQRVHQLEKNLREAKVRHGVVVVQPKVLAVEGLDGEGPAAAAARSPRVEDVHAGRRTHDDAVLRRLAGPANLELLHALRQINGTAPSTTKRCRRPTMSM